MQSLFWALSAFGLIGGITFAILERQVRRQKWAERLAQITRPEEVRAKTSPEYSPPTITQSSAWQHLQNWAGRDARRRRFDGQIPDTLLLIVAALRAGHSLARAIQMVAEEMPLPISEEFAIALGEISLGLPAAAALARIASRISSSDWDLGVTAITTQLQTGGNLAEILEHISGTIRERVRVQGEIASLTAEARFSALILILLPPVLALLLALRNPHYFQPLTANPLGHVLIVGAITGQILGAIILRRMLILDV
jgi:tight adherence protein B